MRKKIETITRGILIVLFSVMVMAAKDVPNKDTYVKSPMLTNKLPLGPIICKKCPYCCPDNQFSDSPHIKKNGQFPNKRPTEDISDPAIDILKK